MTFSELPVWEQAIIIVGAVLVALIPSLLIVGCVWLKRKREAANNSAPATTHNSSASPAVAMPNSTEMSAPSNNRKVDLVANTEGDNMQNNLLVLPEMDLVESMPHDSDEDAAIDNENTPVDNENTPVNAEETSDDEGGDQWWKDPELIQDFVKFRDRGSKWNAHDATEAQQQLGLDNPAVAEELAARKQWYVKNFWKTNSNITAFQASENPSGASWAAQSLDNTATLEDARELRRRKKWFTAHVAQDDQGDDGQL